MAKKLVSVVLLVASFSLLSAPTAQAGTGAHLIGGVGIIRA